MYLIKQIAIVGLFLITFFLRQGTSMEGIFVDVCSYGIKCTPCGVATMTDPDKWAGVYCTGGIVAGNEIQLRPPCLQSSLDLWHRCIRKNIRCAAFVY